MPRNYTTPPGVKPRMRYNKDTVELAVREVIEGRMQQKDAVKAFGIPQSTLSDKLTGRFMLGSKPGRKPVIPPEIEKVILNYSDSIN